MSLDPNLLVCLKDTLNYYGRQLEKRKLEMILNNILFLESQKYKILKRSSKMTKEISQQ